MNKSELKAVFINATAVGAKYIGIKRERTALTEPEITIIQKGDFGERYDYYMKAYDDELMIKGKDGIRITGVAQGNTFEDIEYQLMPVGFGWKKPISDAIDKSYNKMLAETPPQSEEERLQCETMKEAVKGMFLNASRSAVEARFILDNIKKYEKLFDICMNGDDIQFKEGLIELQREQNKYILQEESNE